MRAHLQQLKSNGVNTGDIDVDSIIQTLQDGALPGQDTLFPVNFLAKDQMVHNMMAGSGQLIGRSQSSEAFFGASSGFSFVCHMLALFLKDSTAAPSTINIHNAMLDLFDGPLPEKFRLQNAHSSHQELPAKSTILILLDSLFARCSLVAEFLHKADLRSLIDRICQQAQRRPEAYRERELMLIHSVVALGYLYHVPLHRTQGCGSATVEA